MVYAIDVGQNEPKTLTQYTTGKLAGLSTIELSAMDAWFEEDEEIFIHPKDLYKVMSTGIVHLQVLFVTKLTMSPSVLIYCNRRVKYGLR